MSTGSSIFRIIKQTIKGSLTVKSVSMAIDERQQHNSVDHSDDAMRQADGQYSVLKHFNIERHMLADAFE